MKIKQTVRQTELYKECSQESYIYLQIQQIANYCSKHFFCEFREHNISQAQQMAEVLFTQFR